jgi:outer membrane receptor protein involved in Fe transport
MHFSNRTTPFVRRAALGAILVLTPCLLKAQTAPASPATTPIELSPFVVQAEDEGWLAGNTMLSNRTNQLLKDVPVTIDAMTKDFMTELGVFEVIEAAQWAANSFVVSEGTRATSTATSGTPQDTNRYTFRGVPNEGGPTRNFFNWAVPADTYNVERVDFGRGSNSLLFGDMEPGGQGNIYTKRATLGRNFGNALAQVGSYESYRANFDYNRTLGKKLAARINLTKSRTGKYFDFNKFGLEAGHLALTYRPFRQTEIRLEGEAGRLRRVWGTNDERIVENRAPGLGFTNKWTVLPNNTIVVNTSLAAVDRTNSSGALLSLTDADPGGFPRHYNWAPDKNLHHQFSTVSAFLDQRVGGVGMQFGFNTQSVVRDRDETQQNNRMSTDSQGRRYIDFTYLHANQRYDTVAYRGMATYDLKLGKYMSQALVGSAEWQETSISQATFQELNDLDAPGVLAAGTARVWYRNYVDEPNAYNPAILRRRPITPTATFNARMFAAAYPEQLTRFWNTAASATGSYFGGRVQTLIGARRDRGYRLTAIPWSGANRTARGEQIPPGSYYDHPERYTLDPALTDIDETSRAYGLVYKVTPSINLYANRSQSYRQANGNAVNFVEEPIGQQRGQTIEYGAKTSFFKGKMVWNLNWYDLTRDNVTFQYQLTGITVPELEDLFNPNGLSSADPRYVTVTTNRMEVRQTYSKGVESTFIFYPGEGWNVRIAASRKKVTQNAAMQRFKALLAEARERGNENPNLIAAAQRIVDAEGGRGQEITGAGAARFGFNYAVNHRFHRQSRLAGFALGLNGSYSDDYLFAYINNVPVRGGKSMTMNGTASYATKVFRHPVTFQLNVRNLIESNYLTVGVVQAAGGVIRHINTYGDPRSFLLTATTTF